MKLKNIIQVTDIDWDADKSEKENLPTNLEIQLIIEQTDEVDLEDVISDWLSDEYGYCHYGFNYNVKSSKTIPEYQIELIWSN